MEAKGSQREAVGAKGKPWEPNGSQKGAKMRQWGAKRMLYHVKTIPKKHVKTRRIKVPKRMRKVIRNNVFLNLIRKR